MTKICNEINEAIMNETEKGFKKQFPELYKVMAKEGSLDMARDAVSVTDVGTNGGSIFIVTTPQHSNYFHLKHGWVGEEDEGIDHDKMEKHAMEFNKLKHKNNPVKITEGKHYNTKVRELAEKMGSKKIRMGLKESKKYINNMLNKDHASPNPLTDKDRKLLSECSTLIEQAIPRLKDVKETRRKGKK